MLVLIVGLILFLGVHSISIVAPGWRDAVANKLGEMRWKGIYSLVAAVGLALIVYGYDLARQQPTLLYATPGFFRHIALLLLLPVFPLLLAAYLPGKIKSKVKNPMLEAVKAWALAHLLVNGMLADVILFGSFLIWAGVDTVSLKRRPPKPVPTLPFHPVNDVIVLVGGLAIYVLFFLWGHEWLIGVDPCC